MNLMGMKHEELMAYPDLKLAVVAIFLDQAGSNKATLII